MAGSIVCYFDFVSPHSYIAMPAIEAVAAKHGRSLDWRVVSVFRIWDAIDYHPMGKPNKEPLEYFVISEVRYENRPYAFIDNERVPIPVSVEVGVRVRACLAGDSRCGGGEWRNVYFLTIRDSAHWHILDRGPTPIDE